MMYITYLTHVFRAFNIFEGVQLAFYAPLKGTDDDAWFKSLESSAYSALYRGPYMILGNSTRNGKQKEEL
jgi:hypothetical protein